MPTAKAHTGNLWQYWEAEFRLVMIQEVPPPTTGPCHLNLSLHQRTGILRDKGSAILKMGSRYAYEKSDFPKVSRSSSEPQAKTTAGRTTGKK